MSEDKMFEVKGAVKTPPSERSANGDVVKKDALIITSEVNKLEEGEWLKLEIMDRAYHERLRVRLAYMHLKVSVRRNTHDTSIPAELYIRRKIEGE